MVNALPIATLYLGQLSHKVEATGLTKRNADAITQTINAWNSNLWVELDIRLALAFVVSMAMIFGIAIGWKLHKIVARKENYHGDEEAVLERP